MLSSEDIDDLHQASVEFIASGKNSEDEAAAIRAMREILDGEPRGGVRKMDLETGEVRSCD